MTLHSDAADRPRISSARGLRVPLPAATLAELARLLDPVLVLVAALIAKLVYLDWWTGDDRELTSYLVIGTMGAAIAGGLLERSNLHLGAVNQSSINRPLRIVLTLALSFAVVLAWLYALKASGSVSRGWFGLWFALSCACLVAVRIAYARFGGVPLRSAAGLRQLAIIALPGPGRRLAAILERSGEVNVVTKVVPETAGKQRKGLFPADVIGQLGSADEVIVCSDGIEVNELRNILAALEGLPVDRYLYSELYSRVLPVRGIAMVADMPLMAVGRRPISGSGQFMKRALDIGVSGTVLLVLLPLLLLIAIAIRIETSGPAIFRQKRHGLKGRVIKVAKFRTMMVTEDGPVIRQARANDPRVTRVGWVLRRTSLDELPQLWNVLIGDMSLVGPRPHTIAHDDFYGSMLERYSNRMQVKPGITGWAQINGLRGPTDDPELMRERVRYDLYYIDNWSIWFDLEIILLTPFYGLVHRNAV